MGLKDLEQFAQQEAETSAQSQAVNQSLSRGLDENPDEYAKLLKISAQTGIAPDLAKDFRPELERRQKLQDFSVDDLVRSNPKTSRFLADPSNAAVAHDDVSNLSTLEQVLLKPVDLTRSGVQGVVGQGLGSTLSGAGELYNVASRSLERLLDQVLPNSVMSALRTPVPWFVDPGQVLKRPGQSFKDIGEVIAVPKERQGLDTDVASGVGQLGFQIAQYLLTGGTLSAVSLYSQGADVMATKTAKDEGTGPLADVLGMNPETARDTAIVSGAAITALTEKYGLDKILNRVPPEIKNRTLRFIADKVMAGGIEAGQEITEGLLHDLTRRVLTEENAPILEGALKEGTVAGLSAAIVRSAFGVRSYRESKQQEEVIKALSGDSKLRDRLPEKYRDFVAQVTEDGPVQNAFIPVEQFNKFFQSQDIDPAQAAEQFGVKNYDEAVGLGADVVIPMDRFAADFAPTDYLQGLAADIKFEQGGMTPRERELYLANQESQDAEIERIIAQQDAQGGVIQAIQEIVTDVEGQLVSVGTDPSTARSQATALRGVAVLVERDLRARAEASGEQVTDEQVLDAVREVWKGYGLDISRPMPGILTQRPDVDINIDPLLDAIRAGNFPSGQTVMGDSLVEFVRSRGGLAPRGELVDVDLDNRPFQRNLVQPGGLTIERAATLAVEAGYFPGMESGQITETDLLDALDNEIRGQSTTFSAIETNTDALAMREAMNSLSEYLGSLGIDLNAVTDNAQVRALIDAARNTPELGGVVSQLDQLVQRVLVGEVRTLPAQMEVDGVMRPTTNSEGRQIHPTQEGVTNFWRWFGDSKLVDGDGKPLVMYHGTGGDFSQIDLELAGTSTDAGNLGTGFYVTPADFIADTYARMSAGSPNVMPMYVSAQNPLNIGTLDESYIDAVKRLTNEWGMTEQPVFDGTKQKNQAWSDEFAQAAQSRGYDSVASYTPAGELLQLVGFDQNQFKSSTGNDGTFGTDTNNILFQGEVIGEGEVKRVLRREPGQFDQIEQAAFDEFLSTRPDADRILASLQEHKGTPWAKQAVEGIFTRQAMRMLVNGQQPQFQSSMDSGQVKKVRETLLKRGIDGLWGLLEADGGLMGGAAKPVNNVNSSFINCSPSKDCAQYCYATKGNYQYANVIVKSELVTLAVELDPVRSARRVAAEYKATAEFANKKALRLFDKGDGDMAWLPFIKELNNQGIRTQIFSKVPEFLRAVPDMNLRLLSIDDSNMDMADQNQDLPVAFVYTGKSQIDALAKMAARNQIQVVLPVKLGQKLLDGTEITDLKKAVPEVKPYLCPIDAGFKKLGKTSQPGTWNCTKCDVNGGVGCFHGTATNAVMKSLEAKPATQQERAQRILDLRSQINAITSATATDVAEAGRVPPGGVEGLLREVDTLLGELLRDYDTQPKTGATVEIGRGAVDAGGQPGGPVSGRRVIPIQRLYQSDAGAAGGSVDVTQTPGFQARFGDSQVVDAEGKPLLVYHGTGAKFDSFKTGRAGGIYFSPSQDFAKGYGQNIVAAYLKVDNLADLTDPNSEAYKLAVKTFNEGGGFSHNEDAMEGRESPDFDPAIDETWEMFDVLENGVGDALRAAGYDGLKLNEYGGEVSYVVFDPAQIESQGAIDANDPNTLNQGENLDDKRGFIQFGKERKFNIVLLEKANLSTFLHETGHFYLEVLGDLATAPGASEAITQDYAKVLKFLGLESRDQLTLDGKAPGSAEYKRAVEAHEKFARANEAYLMEGNAPTPELRDVFQRFKSWMTMIYRQITALNVKLTDEVREVFDRVYATDAEIEAAKGEVNVDPLFLDAATAGMTQAEFEAYRASVVQATESGKEALTAKLMRELMRARKTWWKEARETMRAEVEAEVDAQPVYQAFKTLVGGKMDDDTEIKLNKESLVKKYGADFVKRLPRSFGRIYTTKGGMDADTAAEFLNFESGDALVEAVVGMRDRKQLIEAETDQRMREVHGDMMTDGTIADEAKIAMHNSQRENLLMAELRALRRKQREVAPFVQLEREKARQDRRNARAAADVPPAQAFRRAAVGLIGQTPLRDLDANRYLLASRRAAKQAFDAMSKGDYMLAADAKQKELLNHFMYLEARKAKEQADKILKYAAKFEKGTTREQMGKAGGTYLEQIDAILDRYEFRRVPLSKLDRRASLADWIAEQEALGLEPSISAELLNEARQVNYRQASIDELRAVYDAVRNIEHLARLKNKLLTKQAEIAFDDAIAELVAAAENMTAGKSGKSKGKRKPLPLDMSAMTMREKAADTVSRMDGMLLKMEQVVEWLDNGNVNGPWHTYLWNPIAEAQTAEYDLTRQLTERMAKALEAMPKEQRLSMLDTFNVPGMGKVTRKFLISVAMNMGNQGNIDKMMRGMGWDMAQIERGLAKLNDADWTFVQETWDTINSVWPQIAELEKRMTGLEPPKVEAQPYQVRNEQGEVTRTLEGGYYPLVYDPRMSEQGAKQEAGNLGQLFEEGYVRATTPKGHTQARMEGFAAPMLFDFEQVVTQHMAKVVKDLTHREAVVMANKILTNREIRSVLQETMGPAYEKQMLPWLRSVVNDRNGGSVQGLTDFSRWMMSARANIVAAVMGFKATTAISQITGISQSLDKVKGRYIGQALLEFMRHPVATTRQVRELSGEMRNRSNTLDRDIRDQLRNLTGQNSTWAQAQRFAFHGIAIADAMVTVPTWMGAYRQALDSGADEATARLEADAAVRLTQGGAGAKDLAAIQRNNELAKAVTMFYSYFSVLYNRQRDMGRDVQEIRDMPRFLSRVFFTIMVPAVMGELILGRGPDEDEEPEAWAIRKALLYPFMSVPILRDVVSSIDSGYDYRFSPMAAVFDKIGKAATSTGKVIEGDIDWDEYALRVAETIGYVFGVAGTAQISATGKYLWRVNEGEENPDNIAELLAYALLGKRKED
jgi:hypothetical protein